MIQNLMNAFADSDLDCAQWHDGALRELAEIALKTMRNPTDAMLLAPGKPYGGSVAEELGLLRRKESWQQMIDEALK